MAVLFFAGLVLLNVAFIVYTAVKNWIEKRRLKKIEAQKKAYGEEIAARKKEKAERLRREQEERAIRLARLEIVSEESDHAWKRKKQARAAIKILEKRLS